MKLEVLKDNKNITNLARANVLLLEEMKETKQLVETFNRNFSSRINEHLKLVGILTSNISKLNEKSDAMYSSLIADLDTQMIQTLIKEQLKLEIDKRKNVSALNEQISHVFKLLETVNNISPDKTQELASIKLESNILCESSVFEDNKQISENANRYASAVKNYTSSVATMVNECCNKMLTSCDDTSVTALASLKSNTMNEQKTLKDTFKFWKQSLQSIEEQFRNPKNVVLNIQKAIALTEHELQTMKKEYISM